MTTDPHGGHHTPLAKRRGIVFQSSEIYGGLRCLGLRPARGRAQAQHHRRLVARHGPAARRHRRPRRRDPHAPAGSGRRPATSPASPTRWSTARHCKHRFRADQLSDGTPIGGWRSARIAASRAHRAAQLQPDVQDLHGSGRGRRRASSTCAPRPRRGSSSTSRTSSNASRQKIRSASRQIGKSFRNEITPGNFLFRTREFEQMEMEFFVKPGDDEEWYQYWKDTRFSWLYQKSAFTPARLRLREHGRTSSRTTRRAAPTSSTSSPSVVRARGHREPQRLRPEAHSESAARTSRSSTRRTASASSPT